MLAVASSIMTILFFLKMALQMQIKDFSPDDRLSPFSYISNDSSPEEVSASFERDKLLSLSFLAAWIALISSSFWSSIFYS